MVFNYDILICFQTSCEAHVWWMLFAGMKGSGKGFIGKTALFSAEYLQITQEWDSWIAEEYRQAIASYFYEKTVIMHSSNKLTNLQG